MKDRFFAYAAGPFLVAYLLLLLGSSYVSQQNLRQASNNALLFNLEKRASTLSYFHSERKNDINTLAEDRTLSVFFSNRTLGMSTKYDLRASLLSMREKFQEIVENRKLNQAPIYLRLLFTETDGNTLVDVGLSSGKRVPLQSKDLMETKEITTFVFQDEEQIHSIILFPYFYKEKRMGTIIAEINRDEVIRYLIHPPPSENIQYAFLITDSKHILTHKPPKIQQSDSNNLVLGTIPALPVDNFASFEKMPIPGTPFILAARYYHKGVLGTFLTSSWYLFSLVILALPVLYSVVIGVRTRTHTLLLRTRFEEAERQSTLLNKKNKLLEREVQKRLTSEARLQTLVETIPDLVWLKDPEGIFLSCNHKFERLLGACEKDIVGKTDYDFLNKELADFVREKDKAAMDAAKPLIYEERVIYADDGHKELLETIKTPLRDNDGKLVGVLGIARDITARKQAEEESRYLSVHDPLTGLYNRRVLEERITEEINRAERYKHSLSIFMVDLDHFKLVNDTYGHNIGDIALCHLAKLLEISIRKTDYVARYGGEEFIVVLPETPLLEAKELAERLCEHIREYNIPITAHNTIHITASIGVACFPKHHHSWKGVIEAADSAMYAAKQAGRNQVKIARVEKDTDLLPHHIPHLPP
jgi:diguanylate cyclase (GGDEF)-like protein/PAS domain S-box-containing protein